MRPLGLSLAACSVAVVLVCAPAQAKDRALVIGVNKYSQILEQGVPGRKNLSGAVDDAKTFQALLTSNFGVAAEDMHVLVDEAATREHILSEFQSWLVDDTQPGDRVFFYFAGHGAAIAVKDEGQETTRLTSAIIPADASGDIAVEPFKIDGMILGTDIRKLLDQIKDRNITVMADSCFSGSVSRGALHASTLPANVHSRTLTPNGAIGMTRAEFAGDDKLRLEAKLNGRLLEVEPADAAPKAGGPAAKGSLAVWSAATTNQVTFDIGTRPGGIFTQSFADGLRDKKAKVDDKGHVTAGALLNYVRDQTKSFCEGLGSGCTSLTPELKSDEGYRVAALDAPPVADAGSPAAEGDKPSAEGDKPSAEGDKPSAEGDKPSAEGDKSSAEGDKPSAEGDKPSAEGDKPSAGAGKPGAKGGKPGADPGKKPVVEAEPSGPATAAKMDALFSHQNDFGLKVEMLPSTHLRIGQEIHFRLTSAEAGKVVVFDQTPDGDITQIFPNNKTDRTGHVRANSPLTMPDAYWGIHFRASPPPGSGTLLVLVAEESMDLGQATRALDFKPIKQKARLLQIVAAELEKPVISPDIAKVDEPVRAGRYAFVRIPYTIAP